MYLTLSKKPRKLNRGKSSRKRAALKNKNRKRQLRICMQAKPRRRRG